MTDKFSVSTSAAALSSTSMPSIASTPDASPKAGMSAGDTLIAASNLLNASTEAALRHDGTPALLPFAADSIAIPHKLGAFSALAAASVAAHPTWISDAILSMQAAQGRLHSINTPFSSLLIPVENPKVTELNNEITRMKMTQSAELKSLADKLKNGESTNAQLVQKLEEIENTKDAIIRRENIQHLISRITSLAHEKLLSDDVFKSEFDEGKKFSGFVVSIDIRRSTDLMLKARSPKQFAEFISELCDSLRSVILNNYGVFDKFTGDGILAYFPNFFCDNDLSGYLLRAITDCHSCFKSIYEKHESSFMAVPCEIGLGIGVDYGEMVFVRIGMEMSIVGTPVVYACRLASIAAGKTCFNIPSVAQIEDKFKSSCNIVRDKIGSSSPEVGMTSRLQAD
jgi:hypothetical protein